EDLLACAGIGPDTGTLAADAKAIDALARLVRVIDDLAGIDGRDQVTIDVSLEEDLAARLVIIDVAAFDVRLAHGADELVAELVDRNVASTTGGKRGNEQKSAHGPSGPILAQRTGERENQSAIVLRFARSWRVL